MKDKFIEDYIEIISRFLDNSLTAAEFNSSYLKMFKEEKRWGGEELHEILNELFYSADEFVEDISIVEEGCINETTFRKAAEVAYHQLKALFHA